MKIVVTGHKGYIGSALMERLRAEYDPRGLLGVDLKGKPALDVTGSGARLIVKDFQPDVIVNLAGISGREAVGEAGEEKSKAVNASAPIALRKTCEGAYFIQAGSCSSYDLMPNTYAKFKEMAEWSLIHSPPVLLCRFGTVYGYNERNMRWDLPLHKMVRDAVMTGTVTIPVNRLNRPWLALQSLVDFIAQQIRYWEVGFPLRHTAVLPLADCNATLRYAAGLVQRVCRNLLHKVEIAYNPDHSDPRSYSVPARLAGLDVLEVERIARECMEKEWND
jgi:nucleoside-diphosphate-sugar epimerase